MAETTCAVEGCPRPRRSRGWCNTHYERWRHTGVVGGMADGRARPVAECSVDGCDRIAKSRGWCYKHYARWKAHGDPTTTVRNYGAYRSITDNGYVRVWMPRHPLANATGYVAEHRQVAWDAGLFTDRSLHVHHINEIKTDNRIENLEIKSNSDHARDHMAAAGEVTNQFGTFRLRRLR